MYNQFERQAVTNLQRYLRQLAYENAESTQPPIDGIFDTVTRKALIEFQTRNNLSPTGVADKQTWEILFNTYLKSINTNSPSRKPYIWPRNTNNNILSPGENSFYVTAVQFMLRELSNDYGEIFNIKITGQYDDETSSAVAHFQSINSLPVTSIINKETWDRITDAYNRRANEYQE